MAAKEWERTVKLTKLRAEQVSLQKELASLNNALFAGKRRKEIEARLAQIEYELKKYHSPTIKNDRGTIVQ